MVDIHKIIEHALEKDVTDIHLISEEKPIYRVGNALVKMQTSAVLNKKDMSEIYNYFANGNRNNESNIKYEYKGTNFQVNLSSTNKDAVVTMKILKKELPEYEELELPDILRKMTHETLIKNKLVSSFKLDNFNSGTTIVEIRKRN